MNITGVITEYNPFHNGHAYHISEARRLTNADYVIAVMSGDFVQRGEPAVIDKFSRTKMALLNGADLVIELPVRHATGSAEYFAFGGVNILDSLGCVTHLCFGSECANPDLIKDTAAFFFSEPDSYRANLQKNLKGGMTFPQARANALTCIGHHEFSTLLSFPNNILGVEYCKALLSLDSHITPLTIKRKGASYHNMDLSQEFSSATAIRTALVQQRILPDNSVPASVKMILNDASGHLAPITADDFSSMLHYQLLTLNTWDELTNFFDIPDTLAQRIFRLRYEFTDFNSFVNLVKTKNITELSVRRALIHILLRIKADTAVSTYARVLGFRKDASLLLRELKETSRIPLILKASEYKEQLAEDIFASLVYRSIVTKKFGAAPYDELRQSLILI